MNKSKSNLLGLILLIFGITSAIMGTFFYQNAITGVITQINLGETVMAYLPNMQWTGILAMTGIIEIIIGVGFIFSTKFD